MAPETLPQPRALLGPRTTLGLGGPAERLVVAQDEASLIQAARQAHARGPTLLLGGGSNLVIADAGFPGTAIAVETRGVQRRAEGDTVLLQVAAGEPWDPLVRRCAAAGLAGMECLAGIPGKVGATPVQNVGAYGQEVGEVILRVRVFDLRQGEVVVLAASDCAFGYRDSLFKRDPGRYVVLSVTFALRRGAGGRPRYAALAALLEQRGGQGSPQDVCDAVLALRRSRALVYDPADPESHSAGSFFVNPVVSAVAAERVVRVAREQGLLAPHEEMPRFHTDAGHKLAAAWLIERAGFQRGMVWGGVGISRHHALVLVNRGGGSAAELVQLARRIQRGVHARFGVPLRPEPRLVGFGGDPLALGAEGA